MIKETICKKMSIIRYIFRIVIYNYMNDTKMLIDPHKTFCFLSPNLEYERH